MLNLLVALTLPALFTAAEPVELQYKFGQEEPLHYEMAQDISQSQTMQGQTGTSITRINQGLVTELISTRKDGTVVIANTLETMAITIDAPGVSIEFDSENPEDQDQLANPTISSLAAMLGIQIQLHMSPSGTIIDVPNLKAIHKVVDDMEDPSVQAGIRPMMAKETIIASNEMNYNLLPSQPVSVGDEWARTFEIPFGVASMTTNFEFTLDSVKEGIAHISITGSVSMPPIVDNGIATSLQDSAVTGLLEFNIKEGLPELYTMTNDLTVDARMQGAADPMVVMKMVQKVKMTRLDD